MMMPEIIVSTQGSKELLRLLSKLPKEIKGKAVKNATLAGAKVVREAAKATAPRDLGKLQSLIRSFRVKRGEPAEHIVYNVGVTSNAFYGYFLEYGWNATGPIRRTSRILDNRKKTWIPGRFWLTRATNSSDATALEAVLIRLEKNIVREAKKLAAGIKK